MFTPTTRRYFHTGRDAVRRVVLGFEIGGYDARHVRAVTPSIAHDRERAAVVEVADLEAERTGAAEAKRAELALDPERRHGF